MSHIKLVLCLVALSALAQSQGDFVGTVKRYTNPPQNVFIFQTKSIAELGEPLCIDHLVFHARLLDGDRDSEGDDKGITVTYKLTLTEQRNGITRPRFVNFGRGHLLSYDSPGFPA